MFANGETVEFISATPILDAYSQEQTGEDWATPITQLALSAGVEPIAAEEPLQDGRQAVIVGYRLYLPGTQTVSPAWRVRVRGEVLKVDGRPAQWRSPFTGWEPGTVVQCGRTDG